MADLWNKIKDIFTWCSNNTDTLILIGIGVVCLILAPFIISIVKSIIKGIISIFKLIFNVISYPFRLINQITSYLNNKNKKRVIGTEYSTIPA